MDITSNGGSPSPVVYVGCSKRRRSETPTSSGIHPSDKVSVTGGTEGEINLLKKQLAGAKKQIVQLEENETLHMEIKDTIEKLHKNDKNRLQQQLESAKATIRNLEKEVVEARKSLAVAEGKLSREETEIQVLHQTEVIIIEDENVEDDSIFPIESNTEDMEHNEAISTTSALDLTILTSVEREISQRVSTSLECDETDREVQRYEKHEEIMVNRDSDSAVNSTSQRESNLGNITFNEARIPIPSVNPNGPTSERREAVEAKKKRVEELTRALPLVNTRLSPLNGASTENQQAVSTTQTELEAIERNDSKNHEYQSTGPSTSSSAPGQSISTPQAKAIVTEVRNRKVKSIKLRKRCDKYQIEGANVTKADTRKSDSVNNQSSSVAGPSSGGLFPQPSDGQASSSRVPDGGLSSDPGDATHSRSVPESENDFSPLQQQGEQPILISAGRYCCLVSERYLEVDWKKSYGRSRGRWEHTFRCKLCADKSFRSRTEIQSHVWFQHKNERFFCPHCSRPNDPAEFKSTTLLSLHAKHHHPDLCEPKAFNKEAERKYGPLQPKPKVIWKRR